MYKNTQKSCALLTKTLTMRTSFWQTHAGWILLHEFAHRKHWRASEHFVNWPTAMFLEQKWSIFCRGNRMSHLTPCPQQIIHKQSNHYYITLGGQRGQTQFTVNTKSLDWGLHFQATFFFYLHLLRNESDFIIILITFVVNINTAYHTLQTVFENRVMKPTFLRLLWEYVWKEKWSALPSLCYYEQWWISEWLHAALFCSCRNC